MDHLNNYPEHHNQACGCPYDHVKLRQEKEQMRAEHEEAQRDLPHPIPFEQWYERAWKWNRR